MTTSTSFMKRYKVLQKIGEGSFSEVLKCQNRQNGTLYAAKRLKKIYQNIGEMLESPEVIAMRKISRHPNILYMVESHYDPGSGKVTLIFELMEMSLYDFVKSRKGRILTEVRVKVFLYQMLKGLEHLHQHGIFHRDIKPENILIKGETVKLADLGSIRGIYSRPPYTEYISTRWYRSPECLLTTGFYGPKMDVWALGCVYYELLTLKPLFPGSNEVDQLSKIHSILGTPHARLIAKFRRHKSRNCEYLFPNKEGSGLTYLLPHITLNGREILKLMLVYDPENRSNVGRLLDNRYFNELREQDSSPRQSCSSFSVSRQQPREINQWRNPVLMSYITSERRRKSKVDKAPRNRRSSRLHEGEETLSKIPRVVTSSPNSLPSLAPKKSSLSNFEKSTNPNANVRRKLEPTSWLNNESFSSARLQSLSTDKLPPIYSDKSTTSIPSSRCFNFPSRIPARVPSLLPQQSYPRIVASNSSNNFFNGQSPSCNSFLPRMTLRSTLISASSHSQQDFCKKRAFPPNVPARQTKLATIKEQHLNHPQNHHQYEQSDTLRTLDSKSSKSPVKKMAKHEKSQNPSLVKKLKLRASKESLRGKR